MNAQYDAQYEIYRATVVGAGHLLNKSQTLEDALTAALRLCIQKPGNYAVFAINDDEPIFEMNAFEDRPLRCGDGKGYVQ